MKAPMWVRYMRESGGRAQTAIGGPRFTLGLIATVGGFVLNVDLGVAVGLFAAALFLVEWFVLTPAKMWDEREHKPPTAAPLQLNVHKGGTANIYMGADTSATAYSVKPVSPINQAEPRSRRKSKRDQQPPPPSLGL